MCGLGVEVCGGRGEPGGDIAFIVREPDIVLPMAVTLFICGRVFGAKITNSGGTEVTPRPPAPKRPALPSRDPPELSESSSPPKPLSASSVCVRRSRESPGILK